MDQATALVSVLVTLATASNVVEFKQGAAPWKPPAFCNSLKCPRFAVKKYPNFEERSYAPSQWVTTSLTGTDYEDAQRPMFMKLFDYIGGQNADKTKIKMTCPVRVRIIPGQGAACASNFTMSFFITNDMTKQVPKPDDANVYVEQIPAQTFYVTEFGGYAREFKTWAEHASKLADDLKALKLKDFETKFYFTNGYDSPFKFLNRHNEVWFLKK